MLEKYLYDLRMFDGEGEGDKGGSGEQGDKGGEGDKGSKETKPFMSFPDEASFMSRVKREAGKIQSEFLKNLGFEKEEDLANLIKNQKEQDEKGKTELQKAIDAAEKANKEKEEAISKSQKLALNTEAKLAAIELGVSSEKINYVLKLADFSEAIAKTGEVDSTVVKSAIESVLKDLPELVGKKESGGSKKGGSEFKGGDDDLLSMEKIKAMSAEEAEKRMPEIMKFLEKNNKK